MTGGKAGWGKTVLGWFVVQGDASGADRDSDKPANTSDADALIAKYSGSPAPRPPVELNLKGPLPSVPSSADFATVFEAAGVDAEERDRVTKAQELLRSLPAETPAPAKKQIVEASLKAFGVPTEKIIEAAVQEIEALEAFIRTGQADTQKILTEGNQRIGEIEAEIARVRQLMQQTVEEQEARTNSCNAEKLRIQDVLEFFGQDRVARVVKDSPKLHEPPGS